MGEENLFPGLPRFHHRQQNLQSGLPPPAVGYRRSVVNHGVVDLANYAVPTIGVFGRGNLPALFAP